MMVVDTVDMHYDAVDYLMGIADTRSRWLECCLELEDHYQRTVAARIPVSSWRDIEAVEQDNWAEGIDHNQN